MADPRTRLNQILARLKAWNSRITPQQLAIHEILASSAGHPSVEQIRRGAVVSQAIGETLACGLC